jgi:hypothetical protein
MPPGRRCGSPGSVPPARRVDRSDDSGVAPMYTACTGRPSERTSPKPGMGASQNTGYAAVSGRTPRAASLCHERSTIRG